MKFCVTAAPIAAAPVVEIPPDTANTVALMVEPLLAAMLMFAPLVSLLAEA